MTKLSVVAFEEFQNPHSFFVVGSGGGSGELGRRKVMLLAGSDGIRALRLLCSISGMGIGLGCQPGNQDRGWRTAEVGSGRWEVGGER